MSLIPEIEPYNQYIYKSKHSKYQMVSQLPGVRGLILAPSHSGKSVLLQNIILDIYRNCFEQMFIFSPSIHIDNVWLPVKDYLEHDLKQIEDEKINSLLIHLMRWNSKNNNNSS